MAQKTLMIAANVLKRASLKVINDKLFKIETICYIALQFNNRLITWNYLLLNYDL
jgi:hypothetical protein